MAIGPGVYDEYCTTVREDTNADGVIVIVLGGSEGTGFSCQALEDISGDLPNILEDMAAKIRIDQLGY